MFGTLKPHRCVLTESVRAEHDLFYCGLCKSLGDHYGQLSRALVSHDAVFLGLLVDALAEEPAKEGKCRCPLLPVVHRPIVKPDSVAMRFAAAVQMLLGDQWLADRAIEGKLLARIGRPLASRYVDLARKDLAALGIDVSSLDGFEERQASKEIERVAQTLGARDEIADVARPTGEALAFMLERISDLPGAIDAVKTEAARRALSKLGDGLGRAIYFADALDDLEKDTERGDFNPCIAGRSSTSLSANPSVVAFRVAICAELLHEALADIREAARGLPLLRHRDVLMNILEHELPRGARKAEAKALAYIETSRLVAIAQLSWLERSAQRLFVAVAFLVAWLFGSRDASADTHKQRPSIPPAEGSSTPDAGPSAVPSASSGPPEQVPMPDDMDPKIFDDTMSSSSGGNVDDEKAKNRSTDRSTGTGSGVDTNHHPDDHTGLSKCPCSNCGSNCGTCKNCDCCKVCDCKGCDCCKGGDCCGGGGGGGCCGGGGNCCK